MLSGLFDYFRTRRGIRNIGSLLILVIALIYTGISLLTGDIQTLNDLCSNDPDYPLCINEDTTGEDAIVYSIAYMMEHADDEEKIFCKQFVSANYRSDCIENVYNILPVLTEGIDVDIDINKIWYDKNENVYYYEITFSKDGTYIDNMVVTIDLYYKIWRIDNVVSLNPLEPIDWDLEKMDVILYKVHKGLFDDENIDYCPEHFTGKMILECLKMDGNLFDEETLWSEVYFEETSLNSFTYSLGKNAMNETIYYDITYINRLGEVVVTDLSVYYEE